MLDGWLKSKFYTKCKSLIKMSRTRLEVLKKKKSSVVKFLKNDIADLLKTGLDYNAYCKAEGLLAEQKMIACYSFVEQFCECLSSNLSAMNKQRDCPEECREAVQCMIHAAARIAEFPELRNLRTVFTQRYGNSLESFINKEFAETLRPRPASKEMKLLLLHEIAAEFNIDWNSKSLEQMLFKPPSSQEVNRCESLSETKNRVDKTCTLPSNNEDEVISLGRKDSTGMDSLQAGSSVGSVSDDEVDGHKPFYYRFIPPPYVRPKVTTEESKIQPKANYDVTKEIMDGFANEANLKPMSVRRRPVNSYQDDKPSDPPPGREGFLRSVMNKKEGTTGSRLAQADDDDVDEEEKLLDGLLMQYSKDNVGANLKRPALQSRSAKSEWLAPRGGEEQEGALNNSTARHARALSLQPELLRHVHPKLPDCDDLAARIAALKGR